MMKKTKKSIFRLVWLMLVVFWAVGPSQSALAGNYSGGYGTAEQPYRISTPADMNAIGAHPNDWDNHFVLTNNIDLSAYTGTQFNIIGNDVNAFTGVFDGNGHTISNFTYTTTDADHIGLFGYIDDANALIKDLHLTDPNVDAGVSSRYAGCLVGWLKEARITGCSVTGGSVLLEGLPVQFGTCAGGLMGYNWNGTISNCHATASVTGNSFAGGLVGGNYGTISNCYAAGRVTEGACTGGLVGCNYKVISNCYAAASVVGTGTDHTGGLVGYNWGGTILNCYATGSVTGGHSTGGLVGDNTYYGTISNCYAAGSVTGDGRIGGLVGINGRGTILNCYATGSVTGGNLTGGLVGENYKATISNCYASGSVSGSGDYAGGLVGWNRGGIKNCYSAGQVSGNDYAGGLVGVNEDGGIVNASFWDVNSSNMDTSAGGEGKTTAQMQTISTFTGAGWDFVGEQVNGREDIWRMCVDGLDYPMFWWEFIDGDFVCGDGVDFNDLDVLVQQWLMEKLSADVAPSSGDGVVDFADWAVLADGWQNTIDLNNVAVFAGQWLRFGAYCADIAPTPAGDGMVDMLDFAVLAGHWLMGK